MTSRPLAASLAACLLASTAAAAQSPWVVTIKPNAVQPIGTCADVRVTITDPARGNTPNNPLGDPVTIADFDMSVTTPDGQSVVGQRVDAGHWSACSCQMGLAGTVATITASYPARSLDKNMWVQGVVFRQTTVFTVGVAQSTFNPPGCPAPTRRAAAAAVIGAPVAPPGTAPPPPEAVPNQQVRSAPPPPPPPGAPPRAFNVGGNPVEVDMNWAAPAASPLPTGYVVERWKTADPACCRATSGTLLPQYSNRWGEVMVWPGVWTYQVTAIYANGSRGAVSASYTYAAPETPKYFTAVQTAKNTVALSWKEVQGAAYYVLSGPPTNTTFRVNGTSHTQTGVPVGNTTWKVFAMYEGKTPGAQQGSPMATVNIPVVNPHYRLVAEAIRVTAETVDKPMSEDGMYDEIYLASFAERILRPGPNTGTGKLLEREPLRLSMIHGDVLHWPASERHQAGTASPTGGIRGGDIVSPIWSAPNSNNLMGAPGMILWEGELMPGMHDLVLHPTIWEVDQTAAEQAQSLDGAICRGYLCAWWRFMTGGGSGSAWHGEATAARAGSQIAVIDQDKVWGASPIHLERHDVDRPLGLVVREMPPVHLGLTATMVDKMVVLSSEKIEAALAAGRNTIEVRFWDHAQLPNTPVAHVNWLNGDYTLVIRIERVP